ncbi:MAG TPA: hypothetical protein VIF09_25400 [Polyangiaceae bacterium]|jgi:hypothetical protein
MRTLVVLALSLASCASASSTTVAPTAATGETPVPPAAGECLAAPARKAPEGWIDAGQIVVQVAAGKPVSLEVKDASGKTVQPSGPIDASSPRAAREAMRLAACTAGGLVFVVGAPPPETGAFPIAVLKPVKEDEAGDLAMLCAEPKDMPPGMDPSQKATIAAQMYGERLTSTRYRGWLRRLDKAVHADDAAGRAQSVDELARSAGKSGCWFAEMVRR